MTTELVDLLDRDEEGRIRLRAKECAGCGHVSFPPVWMCPSCRETEDGQEILIGETGTLRSFAVTHVAPLGFKTPYIQALVDIKEGPEVFSQLVVMARPLEDVHVGMTVHLVVGKVSEIPDGRPNYGWQYCACRENSHV